MIRIGHAWSATLVSCIFLHGSPMGHKTRLRTTHNDMDTTFISYYRPLATGLLSWTRIKNHLICTLPLQQTGVLRHLICTSRCVHLHIERDKRKTCWRVLWDSIQGEKKTNKVLAANNWNCISFKRSVDSYVIFTLEFQLIFMAVANEFFF